MVKKKKSVLGSGVLNNYKYFQQQKSAHEKKCQEAKYLQKYIMRLL